MALRRYTLVHEDGSEVVKLIDEAHVAMFRRAPGVVSVEPADDERHQATPVEFEGDGDSSEDLETSDDDEPEAEDDDSEDPEPSEPSEERDDDGEALA